MSDRSTSDSGSVRLPKDARAFETLLAKRTEINAETRYKLGDMSIGDLRAEALELNRRLQALAAAVALSVERAASVREFLTGLEINAISRENGWRDIFVVLKDGGEEADREQSVLIKYMQFLSARKRAIDECIDKKRGLEETDLHPNVETYIALQATMRRRERAHDNEGPGTDEFIRLAVGNTVLLTLPRDGKFEILLAGHEFKINVSGRVFLRDLKGFDYELLPGRNVVGRHPDCEVVLPAELRNISRAHLLLERVDEDKFNLTDLSSKGTFLPAELLLGELRDME